MNWGSRMNWKRLKIGWIFKAESDSNRLWKVCSIQPQPASDAFWEPVAAVYHAPKSQDEKVDQNTLAKLAALIAEKNRVCEQITAITGRPALIGHLGEL